jgi:hypothetical protein
MGRRYDDDVAVQLGEHPGSVQGPAAFIWRERLYVVRQVLGHWRERDAWWEGPEGHRLAGASGEREVWRVSASAGRTRGSGTYHLGRGVPGGAEGATGADDAERAWRLLEVVD